jgi:phosphonate transport system substrate-binding protein
MRAAPIRFATYLAPNMLPVYRAVAAYVGRRLGRPAELVVGGSFAAFESGEVDVGFLCGLPYVMLTRRADPPVEPLAAPVLRGERYGGEPIYFSDVIVRREHPARTFAELRGCRWAYNDRDSHSGYNITRYTLVRLGETRGFFGSVVEAGWHQEAIRLVAEGRVDAAAIDSQVLAVELREHPELRARLRVIDALGPATIQPVVAATRLPTALRDDLQAALLAMGDDAAMREWLEYGFIERFVPVTDARYDDIRAMVAAAEAADFLTLR